MVTTTGTDSSLGTLKMTDTRSYKERDRVLACLSF